MDPTPPPPVAPAPVVPKQGGGGKKWVFFGCGGCLGLIVLLSIGGYFMVSAVFGLIKSSDAYKTALQRAKDSPEVQAALGTPIKEGMVVAGSVNINNGEGTADFTFPISGPKGEGSVIVKAAKPASGNWEYSMLQAHINSSGQDIDLRQSP